MKALDKETAIELLKNMLGPLVDYAEMVGGPPGTYGIKYVYQDPEDYAIEQAISALEKEERYKWHDLKNNPNDLPEKANDDSKSGYSKEVLIISSLFNEVWLGYMKLSDKKWFGSVDGELLSKPVMWKYIELPDENNISSGE